MTTLEHIAGEIQKYISSKGLARKYSASIKKGAYNYAPDHIRALLVVCDIKSHEKWGDYLCVIEPNRCKEGEEETFTIAHILGGTSGDYTAQEAIEIGIHDIARDNR